MGQDAAIRDYLVQEGARFLDEERSDNLFEDNDKATNVLLTDIEGHPHAFVLAAIMDRQISAKHAWEIPIEFQRRRGWDDFSMEALLSLRREDVRETFQKPPALHRYTEKMPELFFAGVKRINERYHDDASEIWQGKPSSAAVIWRFLEFEGIGPKIANMATNILVRDFKVDMSDYSSIDISADAHVRRVFYRLGLVGTKDSVEQVIYRAKDLHPRFPGVLDLPTWDIGRSICKRSKPRCTECDLEGWCQKQGV